jgi:hypothetical protein
MSAANASITSEMNSIVRSRIRDLRSRSFTELGLLPEAETTQLKIGGESVSLSVYRGPHTENGLLIVVQALRDRYWGISTEIQVEGFIARSSGEMAEAAEEALWDFK